jgi:hypothetical protein
MAEMIAGARWYLDVPAPPKLPGGILSVANVIPAPSPHALMGVESQSDACADAHEWTEWCTMTPTAQKVFDSNPELMEGDPFAVYAGVECFAPLADNEARARTRLGYAEGRQVDRHVEQWLQANAIDVGPGPFPVAEAIGVLEGAMSAIYGGVPTLIIPRSKVGCGCLCIHRNLDGSLESLQGSPIANITGDPDNPEPEAWMYATGQITLIQGAVESRSVPQQIIDDQGNFEPMRALAERIYVPLIECIAYKTQVTCS